MELKYVLNPENSHSLAPKIPRPPNAFMIYANENRRKMAQLHPQESNKEISKKLGVSWKALDVSDKKKYFELAKSVDAEHKRKYPENTAPNFIKVNVEMYKIFGLYQNPPGTH